MTNMLKTVMKFGSVLAFAFLAGRAVRTDMEIKETAKSIANANEEIKRMQTEFTNGLHERQEQMNELLEPYGDYFDDALAWVNEHMDDEVEEDSDV